tara:strand:- start:283 stop:762 length:480 start_codon:yes stop_codon:yes gene_type:complete
MKKIFFCFMFLGFLFNLNSQNLEKEEVQRVIEKFFIGFHEKDSLTIASTVYSIDFKLLSTSTAQDGKAVLSPMPFYSFLNVLLQRPSDANWKEKLTGFEIKIDGKLANAWVNYEFWVKGNFSHCGVNSFNLFKGDDGWKIVTLIDSRRIENCNLNSLTN